MKSVYDILQESLQYKPQQKLSELKPFLQEVIENNCKTVLEIGSADGGLTYIFSELFERVVALDINHTANFFKENIIRFTTDSNNSNKLLQKIEELGPYDLIFFDGNHTYEAVKVDFEIYAPLLSVRGIIALHDIKDTLVQRNANCFVSRFVKELEASNLHISTKIFNEFADEWMGDLEREKWVNAGGIQMFKFV